MLHSQHPRYPPKGIRRNKITNAIPQTSWMLDQLYVFSQKLCWIVAGLSWQQWDLKLILKNNLKMTNQRADRGNCSLLFGCLLIIIPPALFPLFSGCFLSAFTNDISKRRSTLNYVLSSQGASTCINLEDPPATWSQCFTGNTPEQRMHHHIGLVLISP